MVKRLAIVAGLALFLGAVAATFLPSSPEGATCGTWVSPEWSDGEAEQMLDDLEGLAADPGALEEIGRADDVRGMTAGVVTVKRLCDDALGTRRTVALVLLGGALVVPAGVLFVGAAGRRDLR